MYFFESIIVLLLRSLCIRQKRKTSLVATVTYLVLSSFTRNAGIANMLMLRRFAVVRLTWFLVIHIRMTSLAYVSILSVFRMFPLFGRRVIWMQEN